MLEIWDVPRALLVMNATPKELMMSPRIKKKYRLISVDI